MRDISFIYDYILSKWTFDSNFEYKKGYSDEFSPMFAVTHENEDIRYGKINFINEITKFYGDWYCESERKYVSEIVGEWFESEKGKVISDIYSKLDNLKVILGNTSWECVEQDGTPYLCKDLILEFKGKHSEKLINKVYNEWFEDAVFIQSEKIMNEPWV